jgi:hypothetical protein
LVASSVRAARGAFSAFDRGIVASMRSTLRALSTLVVSSSLVVLLACPPPKPSSAPPTTTSASVSSVPTIVEPEVASSGASSSSTEGPPGFAVKAPIFSTDACASDADCAAVATCHPDKCVAKAKAGTMPSGMLCTMDCRGGTLDCGYNHCGCAAEGGSGPKRCAVLPGPKP